MEGYKVEARDTSGKKISRIVYTRDIFYHSNDLRDKVIELSGLDARRIISVEHINPLIEILNNK